MKNNSTIRTTTKKPSRPVYKKPGKFKEVPFSNYEKPFNKKPRT